MNLKTRKLLCEVWGEMAREEYAKLDSPKVPEREYLRRFQLYRLADYARLKYVQSLRKELVEE